MSDKVAFEVRDVFETDISKADVLTLYLLPLINLDLKPRILADLRPGTRDVSHAFDMGRWAPDAVVAHHPELDLDRFWRQQVRYGRGGQRLRRVRPTAGRLQAPTFYLDLLRAGAAQGPSVAALVVLAQAATAVGPATTA